MQGADTWLHAGTPASLIGQIRRKQRSGRRANLRYVRVRRRQITCNALCCGERPVPAAYGHTQVALFSVIHVTP